MNGRRWASLLTLASLALAGCIELPEDQRTQEDDATDGHGGSLDFANSIEGQQECRPLDMTGGFSGGQGAGGQGGVSNTPGSFNYGGHVLLRTHTDTHEWQNPSSGATVSWGGQTLVGNFTLRIYDACDVLLFEDSIGTLSQSGSFSMPERGTAGEWRIELDFQLYTGQMGLSINSA